MTAQIHLAWQGPSSQLSLRLPCLPSIPGSTPFATVATVDFGRLRKKKKEGNNIFQARVITLAVGMAVTLGAMYLDTLTGADDILTILPKTFNSVVGPMGGIFFAGMLIPRASGRAVWIAAIVGFLTALGLPIRVSCCRLWDPQPLPLWAPCWMKSSPSGWWRRVWGSPGSFLLSLGQLWNRLGDEFRLSES